jgi:hypothetical protein
VLVSSSLIAGVAVIILIAGVVNGIAGFGFALVGTMALATVIDPATAVVFMIAPILAVNLSLVRELSVEEVRTCGRRFGPLVVGALVGTIVGLVVLDSIPQARSRSVSESSRLPSLPVPNRRFGFRGWNGRKRSVSPNRCQRCSASGLSGSDHRACFGCGGGSGSRRCSGRKASQRCGERTPSADRSPCASERDRRSVGSRGLGIA